MQNEDNTKGPHWSVEESTSIANQLGINLNTGKYNKWDWFVVLNMVYSDFYKAIVAITGNANTKHFVELAKAWLCDKDAPEGKMWYYFVNIMCDEEPEEDYYGREARRYREYEPRYRRMMYPKYEEAVNTLATNLNTDSKSISNAICSINNSISTLSGQVGLSGERIINAINTGDANLASQLANCCCTTQRSIDSVNLNLTKMSYEDQLAVCKQTNTLLNTMNQNTLSLRDANLANTQAIIAKIDNFENLYRQDKYDNLLAKNTSLTNELSQLRQNQYIASAVTAPLATQINTLQNDVNGIKCKMPNTVPVVYPQLTAVNTSTFNSAAMGAAYGANLAEGYTNNCNC